MRPGSVTSLPDSTASTGLLCLLVGAREHRGRRDTEADHVATTTRNTHLVHDTYIGEKREYTQIILETELIALTENNYIPLT